MAPYKPQDYGEYTLTGAQLLTLPQLTSSGIDWFAAPPTERVAAAPDGELHLQMKRVGGQMMSGNGKRRRGLAPPPPPPVIPVVNPAISSVAVMDVGQGNCNVLIDHNHVPVTYYDAGYPLWFFVNSLPNTMRFGNPAYLGPYQPTSLNGMNVILSHWDWDHWRLGHVANLIHLDWTYPNQPVGPSTQNFVNALGVNGHVYPAGAPPGAGVNYTIYPCAPTPLMPAAALMNNSGLAIGFNTRFPAAPALPAPNLHRVMLTADANFNTVAGVVNLAAPAFPRLVGITAAHHGSNNYGAPNNLPAPAPQVAGQGRIAYSYGVSSVSGAHPYGFPGAPAVALYQAAGWGLAANTERSTAEGNAVNPITAGVAPPPPPPAVRGNVRMGDQTPLVYANTAFTTFPALCQLT